jgi:hypothetical protein
MRPSGLPGGFLNAEKLKKNKTNKPEKLKKVVFVPSERSDGNVLHLLGFSNHF